MGDADYVVVMTTLPLDTDAPGFAATLVEEKLAACVNILPEMRSVYRWKGLVEDERERQVVIKTARNCVVRLWERVRELHPYEAPEFLVLPIIDGSDAYLKWVRESTKA